MKTHPDLYDDGDEKAKGLTLQEALASGRPHREVGYEGPWIEPNKGYQYSAQQVRNAWELKPDEPKPYRFWARRHGEASHITTFHDANQRKEGDVLLLDSRPVRRLVEILKSQYTMASPNAEDALRAVEELLNEGEK